MTKITPSGSSAVAMSPMHGKEDLRRCLTALLGGSRPSSSYAATGKMRSLTPRRHDSRGDVDENQNTASTPRGGGVRGGATPRNPAIPKTPRQHLRCAGRTPWSGAPPTTGMQEARRTVSASPRTNVTLTTSRSPGATRPTPPNPDQASRMSTPRHSRMSGGSCGSQFGHFEAESRMNLETQQYLWGIRLQASDNVGSLFLDPRGPPRLGGDLAHGKSTTCLNPVAEDSDAHNQDFRHRPRVPKLHIVTTDTPLHCVSFLKDTSNAEKRIDTAPKAKPGVANPGEAWAGWARDPDVVLDYSNAYMMARRKDKFQLQRENTTSPAEARASLPGFAMKSREDGCLVKPLVGNPQPGEQPHLPHAVPVTETAWHATISADSLRLNRTVGYAPTGEPQPPSTPRGLQKTDVTDWELDATVYAKEEARKTPAPPSAGRLAAYEEQVVERLKLFRALRDPPYFGRPLAPKAPRRSTASISDLMAMTKPDLRDTPRADFRPRKIRETAAARGQLKVARKALREAIDRIPIPEWSSGSMGGSTARSTNYLVPNLWSSFLKAGAEHGGRIQADDLKKLLSAVGLRDMSSRDIDVLFHALDTDHSGGIDWSEFSSMFISSASKE